MSRPTGIAAMLFAGYLLGLGSFSSVAHAQDPDARELFAMHCSGCHTGAPDSRAPSPEALASLSPEQIVLALTNGSMRLQGSRIGGAERRAIAEYLTGRGTSGAVDGVVTGRCAATPAISDPTVGPRWQGWGADRGNRRFQSAEQAGLSAADVPRLVLKWALGYPDATHAWAQPTVAAGRVFVGSHNGTVYSLDAATGCVHWTFVAGGGVRTAILLGPGIDGARHTAYFGDTNANVYAVDADSGREIWRRKLDTHPLARVTGTPALHEGRLYVPMSSYEEVGTADPLYGCCTFRGSVSAVDAVSGAVLWKTYLEREPEPTGVSTAGVTLWGPSGAAIWSAITVDAGRGLVYTATGNAYSDPAGDLINAVIALEMATGRIAWANQVTPGDVFIGGCPRQNDNPNCPDELGPDFDFGNAPILTTTRTGRDIIVIGQKSGLGYAMDPADRGRILWEYRAGVGSALGGMEYGSAVDDAHAYFPVSDMSTPAPGGLHAVDLLTGERVWYAPPPPPICGEPRSGCSAAQAAAITVIPGIVFSGSNDGAMRAYSSADGAIVWEYDTNREFVTVNGVAARGASISGAGGPAVAGGMLFVNSGYGSHGGRAGNVLLAFGLPD
jgi:polyvinyl alcohol dehydrogenase (cytochrome)